jgi:DNA-binding GntR family transcriptional regulator
MKTDLANGKSPLVHGLRHQIVDQLRDDLLCGRFDEGQQIVEQDLVERFGVSRTPIREAIAQLSHEGLLESRPHCSVRVAATPPDKIRQLIVPIRATLESFALATVFDELDEADFRLWDDILERLKAACEQGDCAETVNCDIMFHRSIIRRTGQKDLEALWSSIVVRVRSHFWESHRGYDDLMELYREHKHIVEVLRGGDEQAAIDVLVSNIG